MREKAKLEDNWAWFFSVEVVAVFVVAVEFVAFVRLQELFIIKLYTF